MSPSTTQLERIAEHAPVSEPSDLRKVTQAAAFWGAVSLPAFYLPLLVGGLTTSEAPIFLALMAINVGALLLGHDHRTESATRPHR